MDILKTYVLSACVIALSIMPVSAQVQDPNVAEQVDGFTLEGFNDAGERAWDVSGTQADIFGEEIAISEVDANSYGEQTVNIKAKHGTVDKKSGNVMLQDNVIVTTETGEQLQTDTLRWDKAQNRVSTEDGAVITGEKMKAKGKGLSANPELKTAQLHQDVEVELEAEDRDNDKESIMITCDGPMEMDQMNNIATLRENVVAVRGDQTLRADHVEVHFDKDTRKIKTIICNDNVSITRAGNVTYSEKAIYSAVDQKVILVGRPKLVVTSDKLDDGLLFGE